MENGQKTSPRGFSFILIQLLLWLIKSALGAITESLQCDRYHVCHSELITSSTEGPGSALAPVCPLVLHQVEWVAQRSEVKRS